MADIFCAVQVAPSCRAIVTTARSAYSADFEIIVQVLDFKHRRAEPPHQITRDRVFSPEQLNAKRTQMLRHYVRVGSFAITRDSDLNSQFSAVRGGPQREAADKIRIDASLPNPPSSLPKSRARRSSSGSVRECS